MRDYHQPLFWTSDRDDALRRAVAKSCTDADAAALLTEWLGIEITARALCQRRRRLQIARPPRAPAARELPGLDYEDERTEPRVGLMSEPPPAAERPSSSAPRPLDASVDQYMAEVAKVIDLTRRETSLLDLCEQMNVPPKRARALVEEARRQGKRVALFEEQGDRREHAMREELRELNAAKHRLLADLQDREEQIGVLSALSGAAPPPIVAPRGRGENKQRVGMPWFLFSDWHVEEPVRPANVNGLNEYNLDIADKCIKRCADAVDWFARDTRWDMRELGIWLGGDLYSGHIHEELMESNFLSPVQAVAWLQEKIEAMIMTILANTKFERIVVVCNDGNHGRLTHKIRVATRTANSLEWLLYKMLRVRFAHEPRLQFQIAESEWNYVEVYDKTFAFTHGDSFRYMGGVGGLLIPVRRGLNEMRKYRPVDYVSMGHFHTRMDTVDVAVNGSMIGISPYSMRNHFTPEPRQQSFFLVDSTRGKCVTAPVWM